MFNRREKDFKRCCRSILSTIDGERFFAYLNEDVAKNNCFGKNEFDTYRLLGRREMVIYLLECANNPNLEKVRLVTEEGEQNE